MTGPSPFAVRGVIEGFYGNPWTRIDVVFNRQIVEGITAGSVK